MIQERKFRFVGDPKEYMWPMVEVDRVYNGDLYVKSWGLSVQEAALEHPEDWEEVTEKEQIPNQDLPASEMTKFEMAVFMVLQGMVANSDFMTDYESKSSNAINQIQETFKQLDELK